MIILSLILTLMSKPVIPSFIFGTQIKIFLMKLESYLSPYRQQHNWNLPGSRKVVNSFPVAQLVEHGASNAKIMGSILRESKSW